MEKQIPVYRNGNKGKRVGTLTLDDERDAESHVQLGYSYENKERGLIEITDLSIMDVPKQKEEVK